MVDEMVETMEDALVALKAASSGWKKVERVAVGKVARKVYETAYLKVG